MVSGTDAVAPADRPGPSGGDHAGRPALLVLATQVGFLQRSLLTQPLLNAGSGDTNLRCPSPLAGVPAMPPRRPG
jgi:hypothetical protein